MVIIDEHDLGKTEIQLLTDLIYESTGVRIPEERISYGDPSELDARPDVELDPNTFISAKIDPTYDYGLSVRQIGFLYRRRYIAKHLEGIQFTLKFNRWPMRLSDIVSEQINPYLRYPLSTKDYVDYEITDRNTSRLKIAANPKSLFWIGSQSMAIMLPGTELFKIVDIEELTGFNQYYGPFWV